MGEYFKAVNLTRKEFVHPRSLNCGLKLPEWNYAESAVRQRIAKLIAVGIWSAEDDIQAVSDYGSAVPLSFGKSAELTEDEATAAYEDESMVEVSKRDPQRKAAK